MDSLATAAERQHEDARRTERRPRLLFLARPFPPARRSSCTRTWNIAKQLTRLGWDVTVVTPKPAVWREVDKPEEIEARLKQEGIKRILTDHNWRSLAYNQFNYWNQGLGWMFGGGCRVIARTLGLDDGTGWVAPAERACRVLAKGDVDVIVATSSPPSAFRLAKRLSDRLGCPYVMDYRDPWTQNPHRDKPAMPRRVQEEARLLAKSAAATIVSRSWAENMQAQHGLGSKLQVITNGYDPEDFATVKPIAFGHFAIVYAGVFYPPKRVITPVMRALAQIKRKFNGRADKIFFHYYGQHEQHVLDEASKFDVKDWVVVHGQVTRAEALSAVKGAAVNLVITSVSDEASLPERGIVTGKIFDAVGLAAPTLVICPAGADPEVVVKETGLGRAFRGSDVDGIATYLSYLMSAPDLRPRNLNEYSWASIAKKFDALLQAVKLNSSEQQSMLR